MLRPSVRYWGRKAGAALQVMQDILLHKLKPPALVLDPFAGSGSIGRRLLTLGYTPVLLDLNIYAWLIARVSLGRVRLPADSFWDALDNLRVRIRVNGRRVSIPWRDVLSIRCNGRREPIVRRDCNEEDKTCIAYARNGCSARMDYDDSIEDILDPYPKLALRYPDGRYFDKRRNVDYVHELYSPLMLAAMAAIAKLLRQRRYSIRGSTGSLLWLTLAAIAYSASKMSRQRAGAWAINSYWIPQMHSEYNPFLRFHNRAKAIAKESLGHKVTITPRLLRSLRWSSVYSAAIIWDHVWSLRELTQPETFDALVTDPPHFDEIQYYELSYLHMAWLLLALSLREQRKAIDSYKYEIVVNRQRGITIKKYLRMLHTAFQSIAYVLRRGAPAIIFLHEENHRRLRKLVDAIGEAGFRILDEQSVDMKTKPIGTKTMNREGSMATVIIARRELSR